MKNIALALLLTIIVSACSSGTTVGDIPNNITGTYRGEFESSNENSRGTVTLNIAEDDGGTISGNAIFESFFDDDRCFANGIVTGSTSGFSVFMELSATVTVTTSTPTSEPVTTTTTNPDGTTTTTTTEVSTGVEIEESEEEINVNFQLTQSNNGNTLTGTYVGANCSNATGSGSIVFFR